MMQQIVQLLLPWHEPGLVLLIFEAVMDLPVLQGDIVVLGGPKVEWGEGQDEVED